MAHAEHPALITLGVSHYCEKARWGLQRYGLQNTEEAHAPGFHRPAVRAAGGRGSVPCLRLPWPPARTHTSNSSDGSSDAHPIPPTCVDESTPILRWVDAYAQCAGAMLAPGQQPPPPLFPPGPQGTEAERLCRDFDRKLGPATRRWAYSHLLYAPATAAAMVAPPVPPLERLALRCGGWWLLRPLMAKGMGISPEGGATALQDIRRCFADVAALLADGRRYLTGDAFTAADLTFAALAAPAVGQPYGTAAGMIEQMPEEMRGQVEELREHPAGRFALRLWAEDRGVVLAGGSGGGSDNAAGNVSGAQSTRGVSMHSAL